MSWGANIANEVLGHTERELTFARATIRELEKRIGELEAERTEAHAIVSRVWKALGISSYADAQGKAIDEIVADLLKSHKQQLTERREEELREDERLGKAMARAEAAEQALTAERQRREDCEAALRQEAFTFACGDAAQAYFRKYEPPSETPSSTTEAENE